MVQSGTAFEHHKVALILLQSGETIAKRGRSWLFRRKAVQWSLGISLLIYLCWKNTS